MVAVFNNEAVSSVYGRIYFSGSRFENGPAIVNSILIHLSY